MPDIAPRPALPADVAAITALVDEAYGKYIERMGRKPGPMTADYAKAVSEHQIWVVEEAGHLIAALELVPHEDHLLVENIAVAPGHQGRGLGRKLMAFAEAEALRQGLAETRLYTHQTMVENIALYSRIGYRETGRGQQAGFDRVFMSKALTG